MYWRHTNEYYAAIRSNRLATWTELRNIVPNLKSRDTVKSVRHYLLCKLNIHRHKKYIFYRNI